MLETSMMLGCLIGPVLGAGMYSVGGYLGPFYAFAITNLIVYGYLVTPMLNELSIKEEILKNKIEEQNKNSLD
jgi:hypothetical protein